MRGQEAAKNKYNPLSELIAKQAQDDSWVGRGVANTPTYTLSNNTSGALYMSASGIQQ